MAQQRMVRFEQDAVILREGEQSREMYRIVKGNAEVYVGYGTDKETIIGIIGPQSCFGELGLLCGEPSIYTVVAYSDLYAMRITEEALEDFVETNRHTIVEIMRNMAETMVSMRFQIDLLLKEIEGGKKVDQDTLLRTKKALRSYGMFQSDMHTARMKGITGMLDRGT